jgi:hypothetical protein
MSVAPVEVQQPILHAGHRCDACDSRAYVAAVLKWSPTLRQGGELLFCAHHWAKHAQAITPLLSVLIDETSQLTRRIEDDHHVN